MNRFWKTIESFDGSFARDMKLVDEELEKSIPDSTPYSLYSASRHLLKTRGKKTRPALVILSFRAVNEDRGIEYAIPIAIAVELIHTATIIHDDIIDRSSLRRGVETVNAKWSDDTALLAGDLIFSKAFGIVGSHEKTELSEIISRACMKLAEGEMLEAAHTRDLNITEEVYLEIVERKTAMLFEACTRCGAILGDGSKEEIDTLSKYGYLLGIGFQIADDLLDIVGGSAKFGKPVGIDITLGKPTLVILHALRNAEERDKEILANVIFSRTNSEKEINKALEIIKATESINYASKKGKVFIENAKKEIQCLKDSDAKKALELMADYAISRQF